MSRGDGPVDFLVSYAADDRDWAEWIASHLGALGYGYRLQDPPTGPTDDPFDAINEATATGQDVLVVLSLALLESVRASGAVTTNRLTGPGRIAAVQIEDLEATGDLAELPVATMQHAAADYARSRDLLIGVAQSLRAVPSAYVGDTTYRAPLPAPTALADAYPVAFPPEELVVDDQPQAPTTASRSVGLLTTDWSARPWQTAPAPAATETDGDTETARPAEPTPLAPAAAAPAADPITIDLTEPAVAEPATAEVPAVETVDLVDLVDTPVAAAVGDIPPPPPLPTLADLDPPSPADGADDAHLDQMLSNLRALAGGPEASPASEAVPPPPPLPVQQPLEPVAALADVSIIDLTQEDASESGEDLGEQAPAGLHRPVRFWGRADVLNGLGQRFSGAAGMPRPGLTLVAAPPTLSVVGLVGAPGMGATTVAAHHVDRTVGSVELVWWVRAGNRAALLADLAAMAADLGLDTGSGADITAAVRGFLEVTADPWLLVLDGVTNHDHIADVLPSGGRGQVVLTAHASAALGETNTLPIGPFDAVDSGALLLARTGRDDVSGAHLVAERLGGSPAALHLAACYATGTGLSFVDYLGALDDETPPASLALRRPRSLLEGAVLASVRAADHAAPGLAQGLAAIVAATVDAPFPAAALTAVGADRATLARFGLTSEADGLVLVSPLVRDALAHLGAEGGELAASAADATAEQLASEPSDTGLVLLHAPTLAGVGGASPARASFLLGAADRAGALGATAEARDLLLPALGLAVDALGRDDEAVLNARRSLANLHVDLGEYVEALAVQAAVLEDCERTMGEADPRTVHGVANLAANYGAIGDHDRAVTYGERAVAGLSGLYGADHPETLAAVEALEQSRAQIAAPPPPLPLPEPATEQPDGDAPAADVPGHAVNGSAADEAPLEAVPAQRPDPAPSDAISSDDPIAAAEAAVAQAEAAAGSDSLEALAARHHLAEVTTDQGDHVKAIALFNQVHADAARLLGPDHQDALTARANLAGTHAEAGDHATAVELQTVVVADHERLLGSIHPHTLTARSNLASYLTGAGRYEDAAALLEVVVAEHRQHLGEDHPATLTAQHNLANSLADLGRHTEALELRERVLVARDRVLGTDHPQSLGARNNLANSYADLGRHEDARRLREDVVATRQRVLGHDHPQTLGARNNLANSYAELGMHQEALELRLAVMLDRQRLLGADHPHTLTARNNLANSYVALGRNAEALELREQAYADCLRVLGADHPHTVTARNNLAATLATMGEVARAAELSGTVAPRSSFGTTTASATVGGPVDAGTTITQAAPPSEAASNGNGSNGAGRRKRRFWFWTK